MRISGSGALSADAAELVEDLEHGLPALTDHYSGAEIAGVVRSAASFALARNALEVEARAAGCDVQPRDRETQAQVTAADLRKSLAEVTAMAGRRESELVRRFETHGVVRASSKHAVLLDEMQRFIRPSPPGGPPRVESVLLTAAGRGAGVTAMGAWAAAEAMRAGSVDYARIVTSVDLASAADEAARCGALVEVFAEAKQANRAVIVLDDVDRMTAGIGPSGASAAIVATLRALLREPLPRQMGRGAPGMLLVIGTTSSGRAACTSLEGVFDAVRVQPLVSTAAEAEAILRTSPALGLDPETAATCAACAMVEGTTMGVKPLLLLASRAEALVAWEASAEVKGLGEDKAARQVAVMKELVEEWRLQEGAALDSCAVF